MDQTQLLDWDEDEDLDDPSDGVGGSGETPKPVGRLHLLSSKYGPEKDFWIYPGENVIGRLESCQICLPAASVSKTHAVIEVPSPDGPHLLYDQGSLNRTRRQRVVLIPQVRYSLQDGDTLLFGDVGCQYFLLAPGGTSESPDDSVEVPPTQTDAEATGLAIEETPAPGKKMGFGQVLVQDSDKEEEGEEGENETSRILHPPARDGSVKDGTGGCSKLATSMFSSPSATVVPESDEEGGEAPASEPPCPSLRLCFESQDAEPGSLENGVTAPSSQDRHPPQPAAAQTEVSPETGEVTTKEQAAPTGPGLMDCHLDSDTDLEDEEGVGGASEACALAEDSKALELGSGAGKDEPVGVNPGAGSQTNNQVALSVGRNADVTEEAKGPDLQGLTAHQAAERNDGSGADPDRGTENQHVSLAHQQSCPQNLDGHKAAKGSESRHNFAQAKPDHLSDGEEDRNPDAEEAADNSGVCEQDMPPTESESGSTDMEDVSLKVPNPDALPETPELVDCSDVDSDVAPGELVLQNSDVAGPLSPLSPVGKDSSSCAEESPTKDNNYLDEGAGQDAAAGEVKDPNAVPQRTCRAVNEQTRDLDSEDPLETPGVVVSASVVPQVPSLPILSVDSDTDVEEELENPEVAPEESHVIASPSREGLGSCLEKPEVGPQESAGSVEDTDSDTDVEAASPFHKDSAAEGVEEGSVQGPEKPLDEQETQLLVPMSSSVDGEKGPGSVMAIRVQEESRQGEEEMDMEENGSHSRGSSGTEDDPDLAFQATQCFLPSETSSPKTRKEKDTGATVSVMVPLSPGSSTGSPGSSSPLKDDDTDPDAYMLEATQSFCRELSEAPTQDFGSREEEDAELISQCPAEAEGLPELAAPPAASASASRGQQAASILGESAQPLPTGLPGTELPLQVAGEAAGEEAAKEGESQPFSSGQAIPVGSHQASIPQEVMEASRSEQQEAPEGGGPVEAAQTWTARVEGESEERSTVPVGEVRDAEQVLQQAQEKAAESPAPAPTPAPGRRRSLRSSAAGASPAPASEGRSLRHRGRVGSGDGEGCSEPAAPVPRRRGKRQLSNPTQYMGEPEAKAEQPEGGGASSSKKPRKGEPTGAVRQGRARCSPRGPRTASKLKEETAKAAPSPGARSTARRGKSRAAAEPEQEELLEPPRTRASRRSGSTSVSTPSPKDSGTEVRPGQGLSQATPSSRRRSPRLSTEGKPAGVRAPSRRRSEGAADSGVPAPKVLFTGVIDEEGERVVTELGGTLADSVFDCTHLVTDRVRRTVKFLCALARGIPIVTLDWLEKSKRKSSFLAPDSFFVCDPEQEKNFQFSLTTSLQKAQEEGGLLQGYEIHVTPNVKPEPEHMRDIVRCSGGTFLPRMPRAYKDKRVVISCAEDLPRCKPAQDARVPVADSELILTGILQQKIDLDAHRLDGGALPPPATSPAAPSTRASKRRAGVQTAPAPPSTAKRRR
ncbi:mediator of DNA damage checkpoint protein 1 isoform X2 [Varanus komodoensis]|uniref:mediator of DNA damage checkpoint protein 1 isoform X2 n=1 Tax=Varanus komodoensis TaxID=61221 RepID=UPI001CF7BFEB|nr:mediator of DNA damage checkpoint protein 1 isoform X2 [Varanus komodoensis]